MKINNKLKLAAAIAASTALVGCLDDGTVDTIAASKIADSTDSGLYVETVMDSSCFKAATCSASGFEFPTGYTAVAADASDGDDITTALSDAIFNASEGDTLVLPKGTFKINSTITIDAVNNLTLAGHGIKSTTLDFSTSTGEDGIHFEGVSGVVIRDMSVNEAGKNGIKAVNVDGIHFNYVATVWEAPLTLDTESAYGIYPVESDNIVVENSYAKGSNDAGIYVGQSNNIVVRNNVADYNIAGIEIENSNNADVYNNIAVNNSGGLLSFDLPGLTQASGSNTRWFNNESYNNNTANVGPGTVGQVPSGTGMLILATNDVEIYNNQIHGNKTSSIAITSYFLLDDGTVLDEDDNPTGESRYSDDVAGSYLATMMSGWTPFSRNVQVHNNTFSNNSYRPETQSLLTDAIAGYMTGASPFTGYNPVDFPTIIYDGIGELLANTGMFAPLVVDGTGSGPGPNDESLATIWPALTSPDGNPANGQTATPGALLPYTDAEQHCVYDNIIDNPEGLVASIGSLYGTDPGTAQEPDPINLPNGTPTASLRYSTMGDAATLLDCGDTVNARLTASTATIRGEVYGCGTGGDDESTEAACAL